MTAHGRLMLTVLGGLAEFESTIVLSIGPSTRSIVSRYMRSRVTPGAFLYCS